MRVRWVSASNFSSYCTNPHSLQSTLPKKYRCTFPPHLPWEKVSDAYAVAMTRAVLLRQTEEVCNDLRQPQH